MEHYVVILSLNLFTELYRAEAGCVFGFLLVWTEEWSLVSVTKLQTCPTSRSPRHETVDWTAGRLRTAKARWKKLKLSLSLS